MAGYTRNDTGNNIADGNIINASDLDGEFDAVEAAFNASTGHTHDGTSAEGAPIEVAGPAQDLVITATEVRPKTDNTLDLGTTTLEFKDAFFDGTVKTDTLTVDENATVTGNLTVNGNTTLGNAATDTVTVTADVASDLIPSADGTYDLGASGSEWQDLYIDGTANIDSLVADTADINGGSVDGATLGTNSAITEAQIDNINIDGNAITSTDTNGNIALTPDGTGEVDISKVDIDSGTIDGTTIGGSTPAAGSFTTLNTSGAVVFNEAGADVDFRVEGDTDANLLFVDASADAVGIGTSSPSEKLHVVGRAIISNGTGTNESLSVGTSSSSTGTNFGAIDINGTSYSALYLRTGDTSRFSIFQNQTAVTNIHTLGAFPLALGTDDTERMRITSGGNVGIGITSPSEQLHVLGDIGTENQFIADSAFVASTPGYSFRGDTDTGMFRATTNAVGFATSGTERMRIDSSGNVGIGTSSPIVPLDVVGAAQISDRILVGSGGGTGQGYQFSGDGNTGMYQDAFDQLQFSTGGTERMRIDSTGNVLIGKTSPVNLVTTDGVALNPDGTVSATRTSQVPCNIARQGTDGVLIDFYAQGANEGNISVSGSTVSYNGGHLARWSQLADNTRDEAIVKGTVMSNLDQMAEWTHEGVTEDNEQLNCMKVSDVEGDADVAGVFVNWDNDDDIYTNDMNIAMTGDMVIRIAQGTTVARGDLLMSAGDGTAKPQGDDIVRSKTIAKVTSTHISHTYDDGSYLVPCVLMAC